jgi:hypothetical protein
MISRRFDIVVFNYRRLDLFFSNFGKLHGFNPERDGVTVVSASPSLQESRLIREFEESQGIPVRYLVRPNRGMDQLARAQYFTGAVGTLDDNLSYPYMLQMQEHYLENERPASLWEPARGGGPKGDVVPRGIVFDLDRMERLSEELDLHGFFCDWNNPSFIELDGKRFVAPSGGNFTIATELLRDEGVQRACMDLMRTCDNTYRWCVYAEFMWGVLFFHEGRRFFDLKRERVFEKWRREDFHVAPDDFLGLRRLYTRPAWLRAARRGAEKPVRALKSLAR